MFRALHAVPLKRSPQILQQHHQLERIDRRFFETLVQIETPRAIVDRMDETRRDASAYTRQDD
jgi:hypothetical protein